jgi:hypothetical protein
MTNALETRLVDLVQVAESPLYSAYRWLSRDLGRALALEAFLRLVDGLVARDVLLLWEVDPVSGVRRQLATTPPDLPGRHEALDDLDEQFDPFGLSLTIGPAAEMNADPEWEFDLDFEHGSFLVRAQPGSGQMALDALGALFPDVALQPGAEETVDDHVRISGSINLRTVDIDGSREPP